MFNTHFTCTGGETTEFEAKLLALYSITVLSFVATLELNMKLVVYTSHFLYMEGYK